VPAVVITSSRQPFGLPKLFVDHDLGLQQAVRYLQGLGHKRIALVTRSSPRGVVFRADPAAMLRLGLPYEPALVVEAGSRQECLTVVPTMLDRADRPTALLLATHLYAPYVLGGIAAAGLEIPNDISFITMGDSPWAQYYRPPLTVITFDRVAVGRMAAQYILTRLAGLDAEYLLTEIRSELVIRASCAPLER
jgi:LacI family transcriptional regulator